MRKISLLYEDGTSEETEESRVVPGHFGWDKAESKIKRLEFITEGASVMLTHYSAYNVLPQMKEGRLVGVLLMGLCGELVDVAHYDFDGASIVRDRLPLGRELDGGMAVGWHEGVDGPDPATYIIPLRRN